jgi:rRNA maturation endonuclease Nob1
MGKRYICLKCKTSYPIDPPFCPVCGSTVFKREGELKRTRRRL